MDFIFASDLSEFPVCNERVEYARYERDEYAVNTLGLPATFKYTRSVYELFDLYTYTQWANLDKEFCRKSVEKYCSQMKNKENHVFVLVANGNILYCRDTMPTQEETYTIYMAFLKWNGSSADSTVGGFPFRMYMMYYMPVEAPPPSPVLRRSERLANKSRINYMD